MTPLPCDAARAEAWKARAGLALAMLLWASSFIAFKVAFQGFDPMVAVFGRMLTAALAFLFFRRQLRTAPLAPGDLAALLFMSLCEPCLYFIFEAWALQNTTASQAGMITSLLPLLVALAAGWRLKERFAPRVWAGFALAIAGALWLSLAATAQENAPSPLLGNFQEFLAMVCATGYTIACKKLSARHSPLFLTAVQSFVGSVFFLPALFLPGVALPASFPLLPTLAVLYLGVFITMGAYGLYNYGISRIPAGQAAAFVNLIPVFTAVMGVTLLGERFTPTQCAAAALVLGGVFLSQSGRGRRMGEEDQRTPDRKGDGC